MEKMEDFFIDLSSRSLVRTLKRDVLQQRSDILERIENNDKLNVGLLGCDLDGQVVHYNQSLTNMVGWVRGSSRAASSFFIFFNNFFLIFFSRSSLALLSSPFTNELTLFDDDDDCF